MFITFGGGLVILFSVSYSYVCASTYTHCVQAASDLKVGGHLDKKDLELSEDEESDKEESDSYSEGEDPANQTVVKVSTDDSFSLRAQIVSAV